MVTFGIPQPLGNLQIIVLIVFLIARNRWAALRCPLCHLHGNSRRPFQEADHFGGVQCYTNHFFWIAHDCTLF